MFTKILFPTDFSAHAEKTLECIASLKGAGVGEVLLTHIIDQKAFLRLPDMDPKFLETLKEEAQKLLAQGKSYLESSGFNCKIRVGVGKPFREIINLAQGENISLIVMGSQGKGYIKDMVVGSVSCNVIRYAPVPVLVEKFKVIESLDKITCSFICERLFSKVLYPTDWSRCAQSTLDYVKKLKEAGLEEVVVCHVMSEKLKGLVSKDQFEEFREEDRVKLTSVKKDLQGLGLGVKTYLTIGKAAEDILKIADDEGVSLIVMGTTGKGAFKGMFLGSVSHKILELSKQPILFIKGRECEGQ